MAFCLEADYFQDFRCKCGSCRHSCCKGWQIDVSEQEYFRLIGLDCSAELHHRLECAFAQPEQPTEDCFRMIVPNWLGQCQMQDEDGLCILQKECGAEMLPRVCRFYPRSMKQEGDVCLNCCSGSCEAVIELLLRRDQLHLTTREIPEKPLLALRGHPDFPGLCISCLTKLQDRSLSLADRIDAIADLLGCDARLTGEDVRAILPALEEVSPEIADYIGDELPGDERVLENLLANHLLYTTFPFTDDRLSTKDAAYGLMGLYHLLRMICGCTGERFVDASAAVFHLAEHTSFYFNAFVLLRKKSALACD